MDRLTEKDIQALLPAIAKPVLAERLLSDNIAADAPITRDDLCRALYQRVVQDLVADHNFGHRESAEGSQGRVSLMIKGVPNEVWDYLMEAYDVIHRFDYTSFLAGLSRRK